MLRNRWFRLGATIAVTGLAAAYIVSKIDVGKTAHIIGSASLWWLLLCLVLTMGTVLIQAWRWQLLLRVRGIAESFGWLLRAYFVSYAVGQVLPTGVGGDASRIYETTRRHPGQGSPVAGSVLLERALGGAVTLLLAAVGFLLAIGRYDMGAYLWIEALFVVLTAIAGVVLFSRRMRRVLRFSVPFLRRVKLERPVRAVYEGIHGYRDHPRPLLVVAAATAVAQFARIVSIWASAEAVGIHLSLRPFIVLGPLLFLVDQRARRARGVLRQLPRQARGRRRPRVRDRVPLLRDDARARAAGARVHPLGGNAPQRAGDRLRCLTTRSPWSSSPTTPCPGSSAASSRCAATR